MRHPKSALAARRSLTRQHGAALLIFLILFVTAALTYVVSSLTPEAVEAKRAQQTSASLAQAREALVGYALRYRDDQIVDGQYDRVYGYLPLPDLGTTRNNNTSCTLEGCDAANFTGNALNTTVIGRLPWRTLGLPPLRDGAGECLWYVVSGSHQRQQRVSPMNGDTLGQLDIVVANGTSALSSLISNVHDRPVAIIFSPGTPLPGQDRTASSTDIVGECGGNYDATNYLDAASASVTNYLSGTTNNASGDTSTTPKSMTVQGKIFQSGGNLLPTCQGNDCSLVANDTGATITSDLLFGTIRKSSFFRTDINEMLKRMAKCWSKNLASLSPVAIADYTPPPDKVAGRIPDAAASCSSYLDTSYGDAYDPKGYFSHYRDMIFIARPEPSSGTFTVNGDNTCKGVIVFAGLRGSNQRRTNSDEQKTLSNYLESPNLDGFLNEGSIVFTGDTLFDRSPPQSASADIVLCIPPDSDDLEEVISPDLPSDKQLTSYDPDTRTLTLGRADVSDNDYPAAALFGCSWMPVAHSTGSGFRSYFSFNIEDSGEGFTFAIVDGDRNSAGVCGGARQHLGYSGSSGNASVRSIAYPKIGVEIDTSKQTDVYGVNYGRADPDYAGGHAAIVYWGDEATVDDDNVHGLPVPTVPMPSRAPPRNPPVPATVTQHGDGVARLDSSSVSKLVGKTIHVRVEVTPASSDSVQQSTTYQVNAWIVKGDSDANIVAAMQDTTRPVTTLYPTISTAAFIHLQNQATIYDIQGGTCSVDSPCVAGQSCVSGYCYTQTMENIRLGFTTSQSTVAKNQVIRIQNFTTTWLP
jgi:hypothetical protein